MQAPGNVLGVAALKLTAAKVFVRDFTTQAPKVWTDRKCRTKPRLPPLPLENDVTTLQRSFSLRDGLQQLKERKWSVFDVQYLLLASLTIFSLWIIEPAAPVIKTAAFLGYMLLLAMPATNQFFLPSWPIWVYLLFFFSSRYV